jgi:hypothetical protein
MPDRFGPIACDYATVRTLAVIFVLALITIDFEVYADASLLTLLSRDAATVGIAHGLKHW